MNTRGFSEENYYGIYPILEAYDIRKYFLRNLIGVCIR